MGLELHRSGGILISGILTLIVLPIVYDLFTRQNEKSSVLSMGVNMNSLIELLIHSQCVISGDSNDPQWVWDKLARVLLPA